MPKRPSRRDDRLVVPGLLTAIEIAVSVAALQQYLSGGGRTAVGSFVLLSLGAGLAMVLWFMLYGGYKWPRLQRVAGAPAIVLAALMVCVAYVMIVRPEAGVRIVALVCDSDPETVVVQNSGNEPQSLAGWRLETGSGQEFKLAKAGRLYSSETIAVFSGREAPDDDPPSGSYMWTHEYRFPDDDPRAYARLVSDVGEEVHRRYCQTSTTQLWQPGTYRGTTSQGRPVEFDVIEEGRAIGRIKFDAKGTCPVSTSDSGPQPAGCTCEVRQETVMSSPWPIGNKGVSYAPGDFDFSAIFESTTTASGFLHVHTSGTAAAGAPCDSGYVTWTAHVE